MQRLFRWWGLAAFVAVIAVLALLYALFMDSLLRHVIIRSGSTLVGAKVDLAKVELHLLDGKLILKQLQIANARAPMRNLLSVETLSADLDVQQLWWRRVHIERMQLLGLQFDSARTESGALPGVKPSGALELLPQMAQFDWQMLADKNGWEKLFDDLQLDSLQSVAALRTELKTAETDFKQRIAQLPTNEQLKAYENRWQQIAGKAQGSQLERALSFVSKAKELDALRRDVKAELAKVKALKSQFETSRERLQQHYERVRSAPERDLAQLLAHTSVDLPGTDKLLSNVLGPALNTRLNKGVDYYRVAEPWLNKARIVAGQHPDAPPPPARFAGLDVQFVEQLPQPLFWLKQAELSGELHWQQWQASFEGLVSDVADRPELVGEPSRLQLKASAQSGGDMQLLIEIDRRQPELSAALQLKARAIRFRDLALAETPALALQIEQGLLDLDVSAQQQPALSELKTTAALHDVQLRMSSNSAERFAQELVAELAKTTAFELELYWRKDAQGEQRSLNSSLDDIAKAAFKRVLSVRIAAKKAEVKAKLQARINSELAGLQQQWGDYAALENILREQGKALEDMSKRELKR